MTWRLKAKLVRWFNSWLICTNIRRILACTPSKNVMLHLFWMVIWTKITLEAYHQMTFFFPRTFLQWQKTALALQRITDLCIWPTSSCLFRYGSFLVSWHTNKIWQQKGFGCIIRNALYCLEICFSLCISNIFMSISCFVFWGWEENEPRWC